MITSDIYTQVKRLEIETNKIINTVFSGEYLSAFKGRGIEFDSVRPYVEGDDIRSIDWNVTARLNQLFVKVFREERELTFFLLVDQSASMMFGSTAETKKELMLKISALISLVSLKNNDRTGLLMFTDKIEKVVMPRKGRKHVLCMIKDLLSFQPSKGRTDLKLAIDTINKLLKKKSVVFILSDFKSTGWQRSLEICAKKHDVIPIVFNDKMEISPNGNMFLRLRDLESGKSMIVNTADKSFVERYKSIYVEQQDKTRKVFIKNKIDCIYLNTGDYYLAKMIIYFKRRIKRRQN